VEQHGENPRKNVIAIIPARYASTRLPGKLLLDICGKPLILHTVGRALKAKTVERVIVAADDERIVNMVTEAGYEAVLTSSEHASGSDRIAEVAEGLPEGSIIVNVQGDEPMIDPATIDRGVRALLDDPNAEIATASEPIESLADLLNGNVVKVVTAADGHALYFSRSPMPFPRDASLKYDGNPNAAVASEPELMSIFRKHTGLYVYRREFLLKFTNMEQTKLEKIEMLEQLRALENGARIIVVEAAGRSVSVDTAEDLEAVRELMAAESITIRNAVSGDVPQIAKVHVESWQRSFTGIAPAEFLQNMSVEKRQTVFEKRLEENGYRMLVADDERHGVVGFIDFGKPDFDNFGYEARIYSFYFLPEFQRRGLGTRLFKACVKKVADDGYESVCLDTLKSSPYRGFYDKQGGRVVAYDKHLLGKQVFETVIYGWNDLQKI
jgi:3-deoxy-manno-octulosonate cytidylyltransferase (CMP-KDO synthetase)